MTIEAPKFDIPEEFQDFAKKEMTQVATAMRWAAQLNEVVMVASGDTPKSIKGIDELMPIDSDVFLASIAKGIMVAKHVRLVSLDKNCDCCDGKELYEMFLHVPTDSPYGEYIVIAIADPAVVNKMRDSKENEPNHVIH